MTEHNNKSSLPVRVIPYLTVLALLGGLIGPFLSFYIGVQVIQATYGIRLTRLEEDIKVLRQEASLQRTVLENKLDIISERLSALAQNVSEIRGKLTPR